MGFLALLVFFPSFSGVIREGGHEGRSALASHRYPQFGSTLSKGHSLCSTVRICINCAGASIYHPPQPPSTFVMHDMRVISLQAMRPIGGGGGEDGAGVRRGRRQAPVRPISHSHTTRRRRGASGRAGAEDPG